MKHTDVFLAVKVPADLIEALQVMAKREDRSRSAVVRRLLRAGVSESRETANA